MRTRQQTIDAILQAAVTPCPEIVASTQWLGSDGNWYSVFGVPYGVKLTDEQRIVGYVYRSPEGTTYGMRYASVESAQAAHAASQESNTRDFREHLEACSETELEFQAEYWLKGKE